MKNISLFTIACFCGILMFSCKKDAPITDPVEILPDYTLPQGNASQAANDKIKSIFDNYGSYFLYVFTQKDYKWIQSTGNGNSAIDTAVLGNPMYAEDMLKFLDDIWLKFLPESFKKGPGLPYRVLMCDTIKTRRNGTGYPPGMEYLYDEYKVLGKSITFAGMNASLRTMTGAQKTTKKNLLIGVIFNYYLGNGIIDIPADFYNLANYVTQPVTPVNAANPANLTAFRNRGFLPSSYNAVNGSPFEWLTSAFTWTTAKTSDAASFMFHITTRTDAQMEPYLAFPAIKQKFDLLVSYYKTKYNIDVRAIANATY